MLLLLLLVVSLLIGCILKFRVGCSAVIGVMIVNVLRLRQAMRVLLMIMLELLMSVLRELLVLGMVCLLWIWRGWMDAEVEGLEGFSIAIRG